LRSEIESGNVEKLNRELNLLEKDVKITSDFKKTRQSLINFQKNLKNISLSKQNRQVIYAKIQKLFDLLFKRQKENREKYERECKVNFDNVQGKLNSLDYEVNNSTNWKEIRNKLKTVQSSLKGQKFLKDQRELIWNRINSYFEKVGNRQTKQQEQYRKKCKENESYLNPKIEKCVSLSYNSTEWRDSREYLKSVQSEMKELKLDNTVRQPFYRRLQESFDRLHKRQDAEYKRYEDESNTNYSKISSKVRELSNSISYSDGKNLKDLRA